MELRTDVKIETSSQFSVLSSQKKREVETQPGNTNCDWELGTENYLYLPMPDRRAMLQKSDLSTGKA
jgi:hypothetical protein